MKRVLVTGVNGLLGTNLTHELLERGYRVRGLLRDRTRYKGWVHPNLELIEGDLFDDLSGVLEQCDYVVHIAAVTDQKITRYEPYRRINFGATAHLFRQAEKNGVQRFVFVSTANTMGNGPREDPGNEQRAVQPPLQNSYYAKSKMEAEAFLQKNRSGMDVVILNPSFMLGGYDNKPSSGRIILEGWPKKVVFYPPGGKNFVHVRDVARGIISSLTNARNGERYLLAHENLSYRQFFRKLNRLTGQRPLMIRIPKFVLLALGQLGSILRHFHIQTPINRVNMKMLCLDNFYSNHKAVTELSMRYQPVEKAIHDSVDYFKNKTNPPRSSWGLKKGEMPAIQPDPVHYWDKILDIYR